MHKSDVWTTIIWHKWTDLAKQNHQSQYLGNLLITNQLPTLCHSKKKDKLPTLCGSHIQRRWKKPEKDMQQANNNVEESRPLTNNSSWNYHK